MPIVLLLLLLLLGGCEEKKIQKAPSKSAIQPAPKHLIFQDKNQTLSLTITKEKIHSNIKKPLVLYFFYTDWCPSCKAQMPELERLYQRFKDDLFIVGVPLDRAHKRASFFCSQNFQANEAFAKIIYPKLQAGANMPIPLLLLTKNDRYFIHYVGAVPYEILQSDIERAKGE